MERKSLCENLFSVRLFFIPFLAAVCWMKWVGVFHPKSLWEIKLLWEGSECGDLQPCWQPCWAICIAGPSISNSTLPLIWTPTISSCAPLRYCCFLCFLLISVSATTASSNRFFRDWKLQIICFLCKPSWIYLTVVVRPQGITSHLVVMKKWQCWLCNPPHPPTGTCDELV